MHLTQMETHWQPTLVRERYRVDKTISDSKDHKQTATNFGLARVLVICSKKENKTKKH